MKFEFKCISLEKKLSKEQTGRRNEHPYIFIRVVKEWYMMKTCVFVSFCPKVWDYLMYLLLYTPSHNCHSSFCLFFVFSMKQVSVTIQGSRNCLELLLKLLKREKQSSCFFFLNKSKYCLLFNHLDWVFSASVSFSQFGIKLLYLLLLVTKYTTFSTHIQTT